MLLQKSTWPGAKKTVCSFTTWWKVVTNCCTTLFPNQRISLKMSFYCSWMDQTAVNTVRRVSGPETGVLVQTGEKESTQKQKRRQEQHRGSDIWYSAFMSLRESAGWMLQNIYSQVCGTNTAVSHRPSLRQSEPDNQNQSGRLQPRLWWH